MHLWSLERLLRPNRKDRGYPLTVTLTEKELQVNGMKVYEADIVADNGVVHILESILWSPGLSAASFVPEIQSRNVGSVRGSPR